MQQIIISGVGGQGVLYVTRLLAQAALTEGRHVLISETHGMAQRGGNVISHLKVGRRETQADFTGPEAEDSRRLEFSSPLIRPGRADILLALHPDGLAAHRYFLKETGKVFCNATATQAGNSVDATRIATELSSPVSANLVLLAFALASGDFFCNPVEIEKILREAGGKRLDTNLKAFQAGLQAAAEKSSP